MWRQYYVILRLCVMFSVLMVLIKQRPFFVILPILNHVKRLKNGVFLVSWYYEDTLKKWRRFVTYAVLYLIYGTPSYVNYVVVTALHDFIVCWLHFSSRLNILFIFTYLWQVRKPLRWKTWITTWPQMENAVMSSAAPARPSRCVLAGIAPAPVVSALLHFYTLPISWTTRGTRGNAVPVVKKLPERIGTAFTLLKCLTH